MMVSLPPAPAKSLKVPDEPTLATPMPPKPVASKTS